MLFTRLARIIIRRYRAVFIVWLLALGLSIPAVLQVQHVIAYSETAYNPASSESSRAQSIVAKEFSISEGSSGVIVISAKEVRGADVRDFAIRLNETLHKDRDLGTINNITSVYDIYYQLLIGYTSVVNLQLYQLKNSTSLATSLEYGIPSIYVNNWSTIVNSGPFTVTGAQIAVYNSQAYNASLNAVLAQTPSAYQPSALAYFRLFHQSWNQTFSPTQTYDKFQLLGSNAPQQREQNVTKGYPRLSSQPVYYNITLPFFSSHGFDPQMMRILTGAVRFFNVYNYCSSSSANCSNYWNCSFNCPNNYWNDSTAIRNFTVNAFGQSLNADNTQQIIIGQIYDLGPSISISAATSFAAQLLRTYSILTYPVQPSRAVYNQFVSSSNNTMLVILDFKTTGQDPKGSIQEIRNDVALANLISGQNMTAYVTGAPAFNYDIEQQSIADVERIDPITIILIIIIIGLFFSSLVAPLIPVSAIGLSVGVAFGFVYIIGTFIT
ncbi:MAG TPA: MMPL family transporter, partial [Candidatus Binatus sp.]|nr:MMPL family transporter [Candidatus Binatus sp.]